MPEHIEQTIVYVVLSGGSHKDLLGVFNAHDSSTNTRFKHTNSLQVILRKDSTASILGVFSNQESAKAVAARDVEHRYMCTINITECEIHGETLKY